MVKWPLVRLMLDYLAEKLDQPAYEDVAVVLDTAIETGFALNRLRPMEIGGDIGPKAVTLTLSSLIDGKLN
jgi:3-isopropylmalate dehydrogenase